MPGSPSHIILYLEQRKIKKPNSNRFDQDIHVLQSVTHLRVCVSHGMMLHINLEKYLVLKIIIYKNDVKKFNKENLFLKHFILTKIRKKKTTKNLFTLKTDEKIIS